MFEIIDSILFTSTWPFWVGSLVLTVLWGVLFMISNENENISKKVLKYDFWFIPGWPVFYAVSTTFFNIVAMWMFDIDEYPMEHLAWSWVILFPFLLILIFLLFVAVIMSLFSLLGLPVGVLYAILDYTKVLQEF